MQVYTAMLLQVDPSWLAHPAVRWPLTVLYLLCLLVIATYGLHRYWLVWLYVRHRRDRRPDPAPFENLPCVTVQLPLFNEAAVAERVIDAACRLDYPADLLQIQVLDDSTDRCADVARSAVGRWAARGVNIQYNHRSHRGGYKAGALAAAQPAATGDFIAIFDADFIPPPDFVHRTIHHFTDPRVAMVQARWSHLNRNDSPLTRAQAVCLDAHFLIEHGGRHRAGRWFNFNGTAGVWRKSAIDDAGGWQGDTLTEDVDLSYRAQLNGWRFIFLPDVLCPAELPTDVASLKSQQHRWAKGTVQVARRLLPRLLAADAPIGCRVEAFFHLTHPIVFIAITLMALLLYPTLLVNLLSFGSQGQGAFIAAFASATLFALGTAGAGVFYVTSQRAQGRSVWRTIAQLPFLMALGIGLALNNARGVIEAVLGAASPFVRTPKGDTAAHAPRRASLLEWLFAAYCLACCRLSLATHGATFGFPFLVLFACGYLYVAIAQVRGRRHQALIRLQCAR